MSYPEDRINELMARLDKNLDALIASATQAKQAIARKDIDALSVFNPPANECKYSRDLLVRASCPVSKQNTTEKDHDNAES